MQAVGVCSCIGMKTEEQQGIALARFHCMAIKWNFQIPWWETRGYTTGLQKIKNKYNAKDKCCKKWVSRTS